jgi:glutamate racemase
LPALQDRHGIPVLGVIAPGAAAAVHASRSGHIGVIGTERTVASGAYHQAIAALQPTARIHARATPLLVSLAEEGWFDHAATEAAVRAYLAPWLADEAVGQIDALVLGCTHYPVFKPVITRVCREVLGHDVALVDSAEAIADALAGLFPQTRTGEAEIELLATDSIERFRRVGGLFFPFGRARVQLVDL